MDLNQFLLWLSTSGGAMAVSSFVLERIAAFQRLTSNTKQVITIVIPVVLSCLALYVSTNISQEIVKLVTPYFTLAGGIVLTYISGQAAHKIDPIRVPIISVDDLTDDKIT